MARLRTLRLSVLAAGLGACGPQSLNNDSRLNHDFGNLSRNGSIPYESCEGNSPEILPKATMYLREVFSFVASSNAATFKGDLAPEKFCFGTIVASSVNAFAKPRMRTINFHTGLLAHAERDAQVAGVMAHEMAHVTMRHDMQSEQHPPGVDAEAWRTATREIRTVSDEMVGVERSIDRLRGIITQHLWDAGELWLKSGDREALVEKARQQHETWLDSLDAGQTAEGLAGPAVTYAAPHSSDPESNTRARLNIQVRQLLQTDEKELTRDAGDSQEARAAAAELAKSIREIREGVESYMDAAVKQEISSVREELRGLLQKRLDLDADLFKGHEERIKLGEGLERGTLENWSEQEADEVGFEMYLRAGLHPTEFNWVSRRQIAATRAQSPSDDEASKECALDARPVRGTETHPSACWRMWNIQVKEREAHAADYAPLLRNAIKTDLELSVSLADVKREIEDYKLSRGAGSEVESETGPILAP